MLHCDTHVCDEGHFKCPRYYCVPWPYVCDGTWNCPEGIDEVQCNRSSCPGLFKCHNSAVCLSSAYLCDDHENAPYCHEKDDQYFCQPKIPICPVHCICLVYVIDCDRIEYVSLLFKSAVPYVSISIRNSNIPRLAQLYRYLQNPLILHLSRNKISELCRYFHFSFSYFISIFDVSENDIFWLRPKCLSNMTFLSILNISRNKLTKIESDAFKESPNLTVIDLSFNNISKLTRSVFRNVMAIKVLNLTYNMFSYIFSNAGPQIHRIITDRYEICCITNTMCNAIPKWPHTCGQLIEKRANILIFLCISIIGINFNILLRIFTDSTSGKAYNRIVKSLSHGHLLFCTGLLILVFSDMHFGSHYSFNDHNWRMSFLCYSVSGLLLTSTFLCLFSINFIALSRYFVVTKPLDSNYKKPKFVLSRLIFGHIFCFAITVSILLSNRILTETGQLPTKLCFLFGNQTMSTFIMTCLVVSLQILSAFFLPIVYILLQISKTEQQGLLKSSTAGDVEKHLKRKVAITCVIHLLHWLPCSFILILILSVRQYPVVILEWMLSSVTPIGIISDPFLYGLASKLKVLIYWIPNKHK